MKTIYFFILLTSSMLFSQEIVFTYDNAGNQTQRELFLNSGKEEFAKNTSELRNDEFERNLKVYPNPTQGRFIVSWGSNFSDLVVQLSLYSPVGIIESFELSKNRDQVSMDLTNQESGIYFVRIILNDGSVISEKIIKL